MTLGLLFAGRIGLLKAVVHIFAQVRSLSSLGLLLTNLTRDSISGAWSGGCGRCAAKRAASGESQRGKHCLHCSLHGIWRSTPSWFVLRSSMRCTTSASGSRWYAPEYVFSISVDIACLGRCQRNESALCMLPLPLCGCLPPSQVVSIVCSATVVLVVLLTTWGPAPIEQPVLHDLSEQVILTSSSLSTSGLCALLFCACAAIKRPRAVAIVPSALAVALYPFDEFDSAFHC